MFYRLSLSVMEYFCPLKTLKYVKYCRFIVLSSFRKFLPGYLYVQYGKELKQDNQSIGKLRPPGDLYTFFSFLLIFTLALWLPSILLFMHLGENLAL